MSPLLAANSPRGLRQQDLPMPRRWGPSRPLTLHRFTRDGFFVPGVFFSRSLLFLKQGFSHCLPGYNQCVLWRVKRHIRLCALCVLSVAAVATQPYGRFFSFRLAATKNLFSAIGAPSSTPPSDHLFFERQKPLFNCFGPLFLSASPLLLNTCCLITVTEAKSAH